MELIPGKRYRLTYIGKAVPSSAYPEKTTIAVEGSGHRIAIGSLKSATTVELLPDPLPTTPGSIIQLRDSVFARTDTTDGYWWKRIKPYTKGDFWGDSDLEGATVLFDAGAVR